MPFELHFVAVPGPTSARLSETRRSRHSHTARQVHAKIRRSRAQKYQQELAQAQFFKEYGTFDLLDQIPRCRKDPFSALVRPLSSQEYFLLNYCAS